MCDRISVPVIVGLGAGIAFVVLFSMVVMTFQERSNANKASIVVIPEGSSLQSSERNNFEPETITVVIGVNNTVTWVNKDVVPVSVRADDRTDPDFYDSTHNKFLMPNETFTFTFTKAGTFGYHSVPGPWRQGTVVILPAAADSPCQTKEEAMAVPQGKLSMKEPTNLPEGYQFLCAEGTSHYVILYYGPPEVLSNVDLPTRNELIGNGAIFVGAQRADPEADDAYYLRDRKSAIERYFNDQGTTIETRVTEINGNLAAVREMCDDCGQGFITYEGGQTEQTSSFALPAAIVFYDGDVRYRLEAFLPSTELEKVAQSLE